MSFVIVMFISRLRIQIVPLPFHSFSNCDWCAPGASERNVRSIETFDVIHWKFSEVECDEKSVLSLITSNVTIVKRISILRCTYKYLRIF